MIKRNLALSGMVLNLIVGLFSSVPAAARLISVPPPAHKQTLNAIAVRSSTAHVDFPTKLTFNISVSGDVNITDIRLRYTLEREAFASVFSESFIEFHPSPSVQAGWVLDMQKIGGLPPGSTINFWWVIKDTSGRRIETARQSIEFEDNRFQWRNINQHNVSIFWYNGSEAFASRLMTTAQQALVRLESNTGAKLTQPIKIYIYANTQDLRGSMIFPAEWTGGVAFTQFAIIAIGISPSNLAWGETAIAHELTHLAVHQMTRNPYAGLPTWLDEGLAVLNEGTPDPGMLSTLNRAISSDSLISLRSLSSPFSAYSDAASLSYAESYSVVSYLVGTFGQPKMAELLETFKSGSGYDDAFERVYGFDMDQLYMLWKQKIGAR